MENDNEQINWYYVKQGKQIGPVSKDEIKSCIKTGFLSSGDMVWKQGSSDWITLTESNLKGLAISPPPVAVPQPSAVIYPPPVVIAMPPQNKIYKQQIVYIILGLFLGGLGIHNFYAGYVGRGIAQLLISILGSILLFPLVGIPALIVGVWVLVEICVVNTDAAGNNFV
jgi:TM2 domain-containing membrane protein YozV